MAHSAVRGDVAGPIDRESLVVLHTIFRRTLGSRISSVKVLEAGRNGYRKSLYVLLMPTESVANARHHAIVIITLVPHLLDSLLARQANFS